MTATSARVRALIATAAASPGTAVPIPPDLAADIAAEQGARCRDEILSIRQREYMPARDGVSPSAPQEPPSSPTGAANE